MGILDCGSGFSTGDTPSELEGLFTNARVGGMQEGKDYIALDMVFQFIAGVLVMSF